MALSKTQHAIRLVLEGAPQRTAAEVAGVSETTLRIAIAKNRNKLLCPCCHQVVREGFDIDYDTLNHSNRDWRTPAQCESDDES